MKRVPLIALLIISVFPFVGVNEVYCQESEERPARKSKGARKPKGAKGKGKRGSRFTDRFESQYPVVYVDEPLLKKYGGHDDQLSRKHWGMDRFRVKALQKLIDDGGLDAVQRAQVLDVLKVKLEILIQGAEKRRNLEYVEIWQQQLQKNFPG